MIIHAYLFIFSVFLCTAKAGQFYFTKKRNHKMSDVIYESLDNSSIRWLAHGDQSALLTSRRVDIMNYENYFTLKKSELKV